KWISNWINQAKGADTRVRRAEQMAERLYMAMDAEHELPPLIEMAFAADARARVGWKRMSLPRRRAELLAVFWYRSPQAQAPRLAKVIQEARKAGARRQS